MLQRVIAPLLADPATTELIVVVDGARDGSYELLNDLVEDDPRLKPMFIENSGQTAAQSAGLEAATCEVVLLIDDDVLAHPGLVTGHARHHATADGGVVIGYMPTVVEEHPTASTFTSVLYAREYERATQAYLDDPAGVLRGLWMGNISLRRADCTRIGLRNPQFDSIAEFYHVDRDFGLRCLEGGLTGVYDQSLRADHILERSVDSFLRNAYAQGVGTAKLHELHEDAIGPFPSDFTLDGLPAPARAIVSSTRHRLVREPLLLGLTAWIKAAGTVHQTRLQLPAARFARKIRQRQGALDTVSARRAV
jgi:glycosyltransferase involved in cell wall biosynthesis